MATCQIFRRFTKFDGFLEVWLDGYCNRDGGARCQRKALRASGKTPEEIPDGLMPNGMMVPVLPLPDIDVDNPMEQTCQYVTVCKSMFDTFRSEDTVEFWKVQFCLNSSGRKCVRRRQLDSGISWSEIPHTLLPDGQHILR
jgi:hypothetical protein